MSATTYRRWGLPLVLGLLVTVASAVLWYGSQPRRGAPAESRPQAPAWKGPAPGLPTYRPSSPLGIGGPRGSGGMRSGMHGPGMLPSPQEMDQGKCAERVRRLVGALAMYAMDYDDRLPPADRWCDGTFRYVQSEEFFHCPTQPNRYGYAYRRDLDGARPSEVALPAQAVILFDSSTSARNAVGSRDDVCRPPRHPSGNTFGYLDGHAATVPAAGR